MLCMRLGLALHARTRNVHRSTPNVQRIRVAFFYSVREGLANFRRARFAVFASTTATAVALVLIGLFAMLSLEARQVASWLRQRVGEMEVFLDDAATEAERRSVHARAETLPPVQEARYVSAEEAQAIFAREFGEGAETYFDEAFLPASVKVRLVASHAHPDSLVQVADAIARWDHVDEVVFNRPLLVQVQRNLELLTLAGGALGALVLLASMVLVGNTIRLTIYARRLLIRTMKLVGATDRFVRRPFVVEGIAQGFLAGLIAGSVLYGLRRALTRYLPQLDPPGGPPLEWYVIGGVVGLGVVLGWLGSTVAVRRFIRRVRLH
jgi:cell division transport system permease protein